MDIKTLNEKLDYLIVDFYEDYYLNEENLDVDIEEDAISEQSGTVSKLLDIVTDFITNNAEGSLADYALMFVNMLKDTISGEYKGISKGTVIALVMFVALDAADVASTVGLIAGLLGSMFTLGGSLIVGLIQKGFIKIAKKPIKKILIKYLAKVNKHLNTLKENQGLQELLQALKQDIDDYREWKLGSDLADAVEG